MIKQIMIPVAAFAVTVTAASAFNSDRLDQIDVDLSNTQISALEEAHELRADGATRDEVHDVLDEAGLDRDKMQEIRTAMHELRNEHREAVEAALEAGDYDAFMTAVADSPRADQITSEADFYQLVEAHELREAGDYEAARAIMTELGIEKGSGEGRSGHRDGGMRDGSGAGFDGEKSNFNQGGTGQRNR